MELLKCLQKHVCDIAECEIMPRFLNVEGCRKIDGSMLSEADLAVQAALLAALPKIIDAPVLGEEMTALEQRHLWQYAQTGLWIVDPIDGTTNFVNGIPHFAVSVAFIREGKPEYGLIYNPISRECFYACRGKGSFLNNRVLPLRRSGSRLLDAVAGIELKRLKSGKLSSCIHTLAPVRCMRSLGSSTLDWCYLAAGRYDVYVHGGQNLWDYAAGALIFEEAGGLLATLEGDDFWSGKHIFQRSVIAAIEPILFENWLKWIRKNQ